MDKDIIKKAVKISVGVIIALMVIVVFFNCVYYVNEGEYAIIKRFDKVEGVRIESGFGVKIPFIESVGTLSKKLAFYDVTPSDVITRDKKSMIVDTYVVWRITEPLKFLQTAGNVNEIQRRLEATIYGSLKTTIGELDQEDIIKSRRDNRINNAILEISAPSLSGYGISLEDVQIKKFDLPASNKQAVFDRMISERNKIAAIYVAEGDEEANMIRNESDKEKEIMISKALSDAAQIEAEGEREYMRILATAYNSTERAEFYSFIRGLDALKTSLVGDKTIILSKDSDLVNLLIKNNLITESAE